MAGEGRAPEAAVMDALLVNGDEIELTPDPPWRWMVPPVKLKLTALPSHMTKAKGEFVIWESEILQAGLLAAGQMYSAPGFDTPGSVITVTLMVTPGTMSASVKDLQQPVGTVATQGTFIANVVPAVNPSTGVPDPLIVKTGTWKIAGQVQSVASSGQPAGQALDGEDDASGVGNAGGANAADAATGEGKVHYVAVAIEDIDGNFLGGHRVAIATPDGNRSNHTLTENGAARVDGIRVEGEAVVRLLDAEIRPPVKQPKLPWIGLSIIDEDGSPLEGVKVEITLGGDPPRIMVTGPKGAIRIDNLKEDGECEVRVLNDASDAPGASVDAGSDDASADAPPGDETGSDGSTGEQAGSGEGSATVTEDEALIQLVDDAGQPRAGERVIVRWADGGEDEFELDETGSLHIDLQGEEGIEVSFPGQPADCISQHDSEA